MDKTLEISLNHSNSGSKKLRLTVPVGYYPIDVVVEPLFKICDATIELDSTGAQISCKAGCSVCCDQLIPLSGAEILYLAGLLDSFPRARRRKLAAGLRLLREKSQRLIATSAEGASSFHQRYFAQGIACPFLENGRCGIYEKRPLACREYNVDTPAHYCNDPYGEPVNRVARGLNLGALLTVFTAKMLRTEKLPIPLFLLDVWEKDVSYARATFDSGLLLENLLQGIRTVVAKSDRFGNFEWRYTDDGEIRDRDIGDNNIDERGSQDHAPGGGSKPAPGRGALKPARIMPPSELPKLLVRYASALNIKKIITALKKVNGLGEGEDRYIEIGSGDGYFRYLAALSGDTGVCRVSNSIIETESDRDIIAESASRGRALLFADARSLTREFGEAFTPLVISMNVLDVFGADEIDGVLAEIYRVLKPRGCLVHVMSSSIHPAVFKGIAGSNRDKVLLPHMEGGYVGVMLVDRGDCPDILRNEASLAELFKHSPEEYMGIANNARVLLDSRRINYETLLLHEYSIDRLSKHFIDRGFEIVYREKLTSSAKRRVNRHHRQLGDINQVTHCLGALMVDKSPGVPRGQVVETSAFAVIAGRKLP